MPALPYMSRGRNEGDNVGAQKGNTMVWAEKKIMGWASTRMSALCNDWMGVFPRPAPLHDADCVFRHLIGASGFAGVQNTWSICTLSLDPSVLILDCITH